MADVPPTLVLAPNRALRSRHGAVDDANAAPPDLIQKIQSLPSFDQVHLLLDELGETYDYQRLLDSLPQPKKGSSIAASADHTTSSLPEALSHLSPSTILALDAVLQQQLPAPASSNYNLCAEHHKLFAADRLKIHEFIVYFGIHSLNKRDFVTALRKLLEAASFDKVYAACNLIRDKRRAQNHRPSQPKARWATADLTGALASLTGSATVSGLRRGEAGKKKKTKSAAVEHEGTEQEDTQQEGAEPEDTVQEDKEEQHLQEDDTAQLHKSATASIGDGHQNSEQPLPRSEGSIGDEQREAGHQDTEQLHRGGRASVGDEQDGNREPLDDSGGGDGFQVDREPDTPQQSHLSHQSQSQDTGRTPQQSRSTHSTRSQGTGRSPEIGRNDPHPESGLESGLASGGVSFHYSDTGFEITDDFASSPPARTSFLSPTTFAGTPDAEGTTKTSTSPAEHHSRLHSTARSNSPSRSSRALDVSSPSLYIMAAKKRSATSPAPGDPSRSRKPTTIATGNPLKAGLASDSPTELMPHLAKARARNIAERLQRVGTLNADDLYWTIRLLNSNPKEWHVVTPDFVRPEAEKPIAQHAYTGGERGSCPDPDSRSTASYMLVPLFFPSSSHCCLAFLDMNTGEFEVYDPSQEPTRVEGDENANEEGQYAERCKRAILAFLDVLARSPAFKLPKDPADWTAVQSTVRYDNQQAEDAGILCIIAAMQFMVDHGYDVSDDSSVADDTTRVAPTTIARVAIRGAFMALGSGKVTTEKLSAARLTTQITHASTIVNEANIDPDTLKAEYEKLKSSHSEILKYEKLKSSHSEIVKMHHTFLWFVNELPIDADATNKLEEVTTTLDGIKRQQAAAKHRDDSRDAKTLQDTVDLLQAQRDQALEVLRRSEFAAELKNSLVRLQIEKEVTAKRRDVLRMALWSHHAKEAARLQKLANAQQVLAAGYAEEEA
ncbi:hypothetical protein Tdes44962_MAKER06521 [Teratosphaeria destructans]|uniref:Uncharacterized protein n=1 Tax=Teratosphaeria destructans TaxID=418781 RepID=A0A9W7W7H8_9PEZI|nr:hypothetical protein Tdes44962_MAKER06521 [Teratosphaeria destructans]